MHCHSYELGFDSRGRGDESLRFASHTGLVASSTTLKLSCDGELASGFFDRNVYEIATLG